MVNIGEVFENLMLAVKQCYQTVLIGQKLVENASKKCGQTLLPDRSILIEQKLVENAK